MHVDNKKILIGYEKGEKECIKPSVGDADLWIKIWEELHDGKKTFWWKWHM